MKTIYISGKIDGCEPSEIGAKFNRAGHEAREMFTEYLHGRPIRPTVIDPTIIAVIPNGTWQDYIERDLIYLKHCDTIYMLRDWKDSAGARVEHEFAKKLGLEIIYESRR